MIICRNGAPIARAQSQITAPTPTPTPRADQTAFIAGRVFDARTKTPIAGAKIGFKINGEDEVSETVTDARGDYRIEGIAANGDMLYSVEAKGYSERANYSGYEKKRVTVPTQGLRFDFAMLRQGHLQGEVRDHSGRAVAGAQVEVSSNDDQSDIIELAQTDKNGRWSLNALNVAFPGGSIGLNIVASSPRFSQAGIKVKVRPFERAGDETRVNIALPARAVITGPITRGGKPLADAYAEGLGTLDGISGAGLPEILAGTDKNGRYRVSVSAPATFDLGLHQEDWIPQRVTVATKPGQTVIINRDLKPYPYGSIAGRVTDLSGRPLAGASVGLWNRDTSESATYATTDKAGRFVFAKAGPRDDYHVKVYWPKGNSIQGRSDIFRVRSYRTTTGVTVRLDTIKPKLKVPDAPRVVSGKVKVFYRASDNRGVRFVGVMLDGGSLNDGHQQLGVNFDGDKLPRATSGNIEWDTRRSPNGRHRLRVQATDRAGNTARREWFVWIQNKGGHAPNSKAPRGEIAPPSPANASQMRGY